MTDEALQVSDGNAHSVGVEEEAAKTRQEGPIIPLVPPCRLVMRAVTASRVIGRGGESIRALRASSGASVKVLQEELPDALKRREEVIVVISSGEASAVRTGVGGVLDRVFDRGGLPDAAERLRDRPFVADVVVPERAAGPLVGARGERVRRLIEEVGCDVNVTREPLHGVASQKRARVLSRDAASAKAAVCRLQDFLGEFVMDGTLQPEDFELREMLPTEEELERARALAGASEVPVRLLLEGGQTAKIVGKLGQNVRRLRDIADVSIDDAPAPPFDATERICSVSRSALSDRLRVVRLVVADIASQDATFGDGNVDVAEGSGAGGGRKVAIRLVLPQDRWTDVATRLDGGDFRSVAPRALPLHGTTHVPFRVLELQGREEDIIEAVWRLHQMLEPWEPVEIPREADEEFPVFVAGLSSDTTKEVLQAHFAAAGPIVHCRIMFDKETMASRCIAKVSFATLEAQKTALVDLNMSELDGRKLSVREFTVGRSGDVRGAASGEDGGLVVSRNSGPPLAAPLASTVASFSANRTTAVPAEALPPLRQPAPMAALVEVPATPIVAERPREAGFSSVPEGRAPPKCDVGIGNAINHIATAHDFSGSASAAARPITEACDSRTNGIGATTALDIGNASHREAASRGFPAGGRDTYDSEKRVTSWQQQLPPPQRVGPASDVRESRGVARCGIQDNVQVSSPALLIEIPSDELAAYIASESSGVARRSGTKLVAHSSLPARAASLSAPASLGCPPLLEVFATSPSVGAVACYLIQVQLQFAAALGHTSR
eukprot:TRINITY_DN63612_c0_g1_i1.p1 TRINITY_DN63612_c0_g1~~TRINITY_DN63612_c0_g1_i1.p1  ORF type:complete len:803 (-),score=146.77 TRINITY_DN63612_c0_g1_i1:104-2449(-)